MSETQKSLKDVKTTAMAIEQAKEGDSDNNEEHEEDVEKEEVVMGPVVTAGSEKDEKVLEELLTEPDVIDFLRKSSTLIFFKDHPWFDHIVCACGYVGKERWIVWTPANSWIAIPPFHCSADVTVHLSIGTIEIYR
jgi:hypothetical protein